jgi:hypothetical protein
VIGFFDAPRVLSAFACVTLPEVGTEFSLDDNVKACKQQPSTILMTLTNPEISSIPSWLKSYRNTIIWSVGMDENSTHTSRIARWNNQALLYESINADSYQ